MAWDWIAQLGLAQLKSRAESNQAGIQAQSLNQQNKDPRMKYEAAPRIDKDSSAVGAAPLGLASVTMSHGGGQNIPIASGMAQQELAAFEQMPAGEGGYMLGSDNPYRSDVAPYQPSLLSRFRRY